MVAFRRGNGFRVCTACNLDFISSVHWVDYVLGCVMGTVGDGTKSQEEGSVGVLKEGAMSTPETQITCEVLFSLSFGGNEEGKPEVRCSCGFRKTYPFMFLARLAYNLHARKEYLMERSEP